MVDSVCRRLRDGVLPGELSPALMLLNRSSSAHSGRALLLHLLASLSSSVASGTAQPGCIVLVATECSPKYYLNFPGFKEDQFLGVCYVDCFVDPLGWRTLLSMQDVLEETKENKPFLKVCHDLRDLDALISLIFQSGTYSKTNAAQFSIFIDSMSLLLEYNSIDSVAKFLNNLRENDKVSSLIWMLHSDLHDEKVIKTLEYLSSMVITMEESRAAVSKKAEENMQDTTEKKLFCEGILRVRQKRHNGRVRELIEKFDIDQFSLSISNKVEDMKAGKISIPKVQFRLQLSDKEQKERAKVILPFEHQGNGRESLLYNGRPDVVATLMSAEKTKDDLQKLAVHEKNFGLVEYLRDSEDERPDSDEDPDDDLDI